MKIIDDHCHLDFSSRHLEEEEKGRVATYEDLDNLIKQNKKDGVVAVVSNGTHYESNLNVLELIKKYDIVKAALGLHPNYVKDVDEKQFEKIIELIKKNKDKIVALGEIGLDNKYPENNDKKRQKKYFAEFLELAEELKKPVIVHSRQAELETIEVIEGYKVKSVVMHYFAGRQHLVKRILNNGWTLSIPTNVVRLQQLQDNVTMADISQIMTETDGPFLSPYKDIQVNEPRFIIESLKKIAEIKKISLEDASERIYKNYKRIYEK